MTNTSLTDRLGNKWDIAQVTVEGKRQTVTDKSTGKHARCRISSRATSCCLPMKESGCCPHEGPRGRAAAELLLKELFRSPNLSHRGG